MHVSVAIVAALGVIVLGALYAVPRDIEGLVESFLSREGFQAEVEDVEVGWLEGVATVEGLRVENTRNGNVVLQVPELRVNVAVGSLLPGRTVRVEQAEAFSPTVDLTGPREERTAWLRP